MRRFVEYVEREEQEEKQKKEEELGRHSAAAGAAAGIAAGVRAAQEGDAKTGHRSRGDRMDYGSIVWSVLCVVTARWVIGMSMLMGKLTGVDDRAPQ